MSGPVPVHTPARTPEALLAIIKQAFNRGDVHALADAYEDDAILAVPPDGCAVQGRDDIRAATAPWLALRPHMTIVVDRKLEADGLSLTHAHWTLTGTGPDGGLMELHGRGTCVARRQPDGTWRIVLDNPLSPT
jgi:uncharacterized protein (TIGR02246 family)